MYKIFIFEDFIKYIKIAFNYVHITLWIALVGIVIGTILGLIIALIRIERIKFLNPICQVLVSFIRGAPIYIQLFLVYFSIPMILNGLSKGEQTISVDKFLSVYLTYGLNNAAYFSEIFRSAIESVPRSQIETAESFAFSRKQIYSKIVIPQSIRIAIPGYGQSVVSAFQDTSLAFSIGIIDMMGKIKNTAGVTARMLEGYVAGTVIFIIISIVINLVFKHIDNKYSFN